MIDWHPPTARETAPIREAIEANRKRRNEQDRKKTNPQQPTKRGKHEHR